MRPLRKAIGRSTLGRGRFVLATVVMSTIALNLSVAGSADAHDPHTARPQRASQVDSTGETQTDSIAHSPSTREATRPRPAAGRLKLPALNDAFLEHVHNKVVHFPIVLSLVAAAGLLLGRRSTELLRFARLLAWASALTAGAAVLSGLSQAPVYEGEPKAWLVLVHRNWGIATAIILTTTALLAQWGRTRQYAWLVGPVAAALVAVTGFLGGVISHG